MAKTQKALCLALMLTLCATAALAQSNPFLSPPAADTATESETPSSNYLEAPPPLLRWSPFPGVSRALREHHRALNARAAELIDLSREPSSDAGSYARLRGLALLSMVVFLYGMVHAALPGHRKVLLVSYFVAHDAPVRHAVFAGLGVALIHSGAAAVVVLGTYFLLRGSLSLALESATATVQVLTSAVILILGAIIVVSKLRELNELRTGRHSSEDEIEQRALGLFRRRFRLLPAIVLSSVIPCPGSAMILMFAISLNVPLLGVFATTVFSVGMALTLVTVSLAALLSKRAVVGVLDGPAGEFLHIGLEGMAGIAMLAIGILSITALV